MGSLTIGQSRGFHASENVKFWTESTISPPYHINPTHVLGWVSPQGGWILPAGYWFPNGRGGYDGFNETEMAARVPTEQKNYIFYNNIANIAGYLLSPLIGLIRVIVNVYFLFTGNSTGNERGYLYAQIIRGVTEMLGGGYILWIPDLIFTIGRGYEPTFGTL